MSDATIDRVRAIIADIVERFADKGATPDELADYLERIPEALSAPQPQPPAEVTELVERLNIDADRLKLSARADLHAICGDVREAANLIVYQAQKLAEAEHDRDEWETNANAAAIGFTKAEARIAVLKKALEDIRDERGVCTTCGEPAEMPSNCVACDESQPCRWGPQDSQKIALAAIASPSPGADSEPTSPKEQIE